MRIAKLLTLVVCAAVCVIPAVSTAQEPTRDDSASQAQRGRVAGAAAVPAIGGEQWFRGGLISTLLMGWLGTGITYMAAANSSATLSTHHRLLIAHEAAAYREAYAAGYREAMTSKRRRTALRGAVWATGIVMFVVLAAGAPVF